MSRYRPSMNAPLLPRRVTYSTLLTNAVATRSPYYAVGHPLHPRAGPRIGSAVQITRNAIDHATDVFGRVREGRSFRERRPQPRV
jgi:hypothetical protein